MDLLSNKTNARAVREALRSLPTKLNNTYKDSIERIEGQCEDYVTLAMQTLSWIFCARRPLQVEELRHALAVRPLDISFDRSGLDEEDSLLAVCCGLITIDEESKIVRLVHYSLQEYLTSVREKLFSDAEFKLSDRPLGAAFCATWRAKS